MLILLPGHKFYLSEVKVIPRSRSLEGQIVSVLTFYRQAGGRPSVLKCSHTTLMLPNSSSFVLRNMDSTHSILSCKFIVVLLVVHSSRAG